MANGTKNRRTWNSWRPLAIAFASITLLVSTATVWAVRANISGAVIGAGTVEVSTTMTALQHPIGGVVEEILATNGDQVEAGDVVIRLEDIELKSDLKVVEGDLFETLANIARLEAAIDGSTELDLHPILFEAASHRDDVKRMIDRQQKQLDEHYLLLESESELLDRQILQVSAQITGIEAQVAAKEDERRFVVEETEKSKELADKGLLKLTTLYTLEKNDALIRGEIGRLNAQIAELRGKIAELELKRNTIGPNAREKAVTELSKLRPQRTRFLERRASIIDLLSKLEIRAPISGRIHDTKVLGLKSVVVKASPLMMIIPDSDHAIVRVRVKATDIDQVYVGQEASLKFRAFNGRHTPIILGKVAQISADVFMDSLTRKNYYEVSVALLDQEMSKLGGVELLPGMPVDAFLATESQTPLNYVLRPLMTYFDRAFRDT